jgi:hypothetical protein
MATKSKPRIGLIVRDIVAEPSPSNRETTYYTWLFRTTTLAPGPADQPNIEGASRYRDPDLDGLTIVVNLYSDADPSFAVEYREVFDVDLARARAMLSRLTSVHRKIEAMERSLGYLGRYDVSGYVLRAAKAIGAERFLITRQGQRRDLDYKGASLWIAQALAEQAPRAQMADPPREAATA